MKIKIVNILSKNYKLAGTLFVPNSSNNLPAVVFYHGMVSQKYAPI